MSQKQKFPINATVRNRVVFNGVTINDITYGYVPQGKIGVVCGHTNDGRAEVLFHGYGIHTFADAVVDDLISRVYTDTDKLEILARFAVEILVTATKEGEEYLTRDVAGIAKEFGLIENSGSDELVTELKDWFLEIDSVANSGLIECISGLLMKDDDFRGVTAVERGDGCESTI